MIHIIVSGHGEFAEGLLSGARLLCGDSPACDAVNFSEGMTPEVLREKLSACVESADGPILFLTDIIGGTPFRECAALATALPNAEVVSGANLQMLTEACVERDDADDLKAFARELISSAQECMTLYSDKLASQAQKKQDAADDDGI
ncbi:PTS sugar transporter subunit IIA [Cardiobacteriaceae bacterium TAE3-ERU3]|nr:PTS sugar transporter subunit IIA [Cardiobacteriaceae bacterium TAE3-ERU3]